MGGASRTCRSASTGSRCTPPGWPSCTRLPRNGWNYPRRCRPAFSVSCLISGTEAKLGCPIGATTGEKYPKTHSGLALAGQDAEMRGKPMDGVTAIILAAGEGKRMRSRRPKVLHPLCGRPLIGYALRAAHTVADRVVMVVSP